MRRSEQREHIFKLLFLEGFHPREEIPGQLELYFERLDEAMEDPLRFSEEDQAYIQEKYLTVREKLPLIDERLNSISEGWKTARMSRVDLAILRLAVYEMAYDEKVPTGVAINEAVELAKRFGTDASGPFVNGLLGRIARDMEQEAPSEDE